MGGRVLADSLKRHIAKDEPEPKLEPMLSMPDYFPLLVFSKGTLEHLAEKVGNAINT